MKFYIIFWVLFLFTASCFGQVGMWQSGNEEVLTNGTLTVKLDFNVGGAIGFVGLNSTGENLVNTSDKGRYIQQSYYAGNAVDRKAEGQSPGWSPWSWNPIQCGDAFEHASVILSNYAIDSNTFYVKTHGMLWDMNNETPQADLEEWVTFASDYVIEVKNKLTCYRTDNIWTEAADHQELPAVYTIGRLNNLVTYQDSLPWSCGQLTIRTTHPPPWDYWTPAESWAAFVDDNFFGLGVYLGDAELFVAGFAGNKKCKGDSHDDCTGYIAPLKTVTLKKTDSLEYTYYLSVGNANDIRNNFALIANRNATCEPVPQKGFKVYPIPAGEELKVDCYIDNIREITLVNLLGQAVLKQSVTGFTTSLNTGFLQQGVYVLRVMDEKGKVLGAQRIVR